MAAKLTIWRRNAGQLFFSFVTSGLVTVAAQDFFARAAPASKERWLAATLLLGTLAAMLGVRLGQRWRLDHGGLRIGLVLAIAAITAVLSAIPWPLVYVALHLVLRGLINLGVQTFDARAAAMVDAGERRMNDHANTALRFLGMLAGPLIFGAVAGAPEVGAAAFLAVGLAGVVAAPALAGGRAAPVNSAAIVSAPGAATAELRLLLAGALAFYAGNFLLAASVAYLAADVYAIPDPIAHAGRLMTVVYGSTVIVSLVIAGRGLRVAPAWTLAGGVALLVTCAGLGTEAARSTSLQIGAGVLLGGAFALFLLAVREAASRAALAGDHRALAAFNNLGNTSALVAFTLMLALVELGRALGVAFVTAIRGGLGGLAIIGLAAVGAALASRGRQGPPRG